MNDDFQDELISAYLDDELSPDERLRVEQRLAENDDARRMVEELRSLRKGLQSLPRFELEPDFAQRVLRSAERRMLTGQPNDQPRATVGRRKRSGQNRNERRLNLRGLLWTGVAIACAVIIGIEFSGRHSRLAFVDKTPSQNDDRVTSRTDGSPVGGSESTSKLKSMVSKNRTEFARKALPLHRKSGVSTEGMSVPQSKTTGKANFSGTHNELRQNDKAKKRASPNAVAGNQSAVANDIAIESAENIESTVAEESAHDKRTSDYASSSAKQRGPSGNQYKEVEKSQAGQHETTDRNASGFFVGRDYLVTVDLAADVASRQAWNAVLKQHDLVGENDESLVLDKQGQLPANDQVFSVSLSQTQADALITTLQERRDDLNVTVHLPSQRPVGKAAAIDAPEKKLPHTETADNDDDSADDFLLNRSPQNAKIDRLAKERQTEADDKTDDVQRKTAKGVRRATKNAGKRKDRAETRKNGKNPESNAPAMPEFSGSEFSGPGLSRSRLSDTQSAPRRKVKMRKWSIAEEKASDEAFGKSLSDQKRAESDTRSKGSLSKRHRDSGLLPPDIPFDNDPGESNRLRSGRLHDHAAEPKVTIVFVLRAADRKTATAPEKAIPADGAVAPLHRDDD